MTNTWHSKKLSAWSESRPRSIGRKKDEAVTITGNRAQGKEGKSGSNGGPLHASEMTNSGLVSGPENKNKKKQSRPAFNGEEVRLYMIRQFEEASKGSKVFSSNQPLDWNASQSKGWKSRKKYGCLSELERALR